MNKFFFRASALAALAVGLSSPVSAQNAVNSHVLTNSADVIYAGLGAGGTWVAGDDGVGYWVDGEEMRGNTFTTLGDYGYKQYGWRESPCVLGTAGGPSGTPGLGLKWPIMAFVEFDGVNPFDQGAGVWNRAACSVASVGAACFPIGGSGGLPYGPAGASANFLLSGLPSGVSSFAQGFNILLPNNGLQGAGAAPSATATLVALASDVALGIGSTGFCWMVTFNWLPSAVPALDDINGWWHWQTSSLDNNQYYIWSNDEQNLWQSNSVAGGSLGLFGFFGNFEIEAMHTVTAPTTNYATAPNGVNGTAPYAAMTGQPLAGDGPEYPAIPSIALPAGGLSPNQGFDLGRHGGVTLNGVGGAGTAGGLGGQDPAAGGFANLPTLGFVTWNGGPTTHATGAVGDPRSHVTWVQTWYDGIFAGLTAGLGGDPGTNGTPDIPVGSGGGNRFPLTMQETLAFAFPSADTSFFGPIFLTPVQDQSGAWLDPYGFAMGAGGTSTIAGSSIHLPVVGATVSASSLGLPVGVQVGTSQLKNFMAPPLLWNKNPANPQENAAGHSVIIPLID